MAPRDNAATLIHDRNQGLYLRTSIRASPHFVSFYVLRVSREPPLSVARVGRRAGWKLCGEAHLVGRRHEKLPERTRRTQSRSELAAGPEPAGEATDHSVVVGIGLPDVEGHPGRPLLRFGRDRFGISVSLRCSITTSKVEPPGFQADTGCCHRTQISLEQAMRSYGSSHTMQANAISTSQRRPATTKERP